MGSIDGLVYRMHPSTRSRAGRGGTCWRAKEALPCGPDNACALRQVRRGHDPVKAGTQQVFMPAQTHRLPLAGARQKEPRPRRGGDLYSQSTCWHEQIQFSWQGHGDSHDPAQAGTYSRSIFAGPNKSTSLGRGTAIPWIRPLAHLSLGFVCLEEGMSIACQEEEPSSSSTGGCLGVTP